MNRLKFCGGHCLATPFSFRGWPLSLISRVDPKLNGKSDGRDKRLCVSSLCHNRWSTRVVPLLFQTGRDHPRRQRNKHHQFSVLPSPMTTETRGNQLAPQHFPPSTATLCVDDGVGSRDNLDGTKGPRLLSLLRSTGGHTKGNSTSPGEEKQLILMTWQFFCFAQASSLYTLLLSFTSGEIEWST